MQSLDKILILSGKIKEFNESVFQDELAFYDNESDKTNRLINEWLMSSVVVLQKIYDNLSGDNELGISENDELSELLSKVGITDSELYILGDVINMLSVIEFKGEF